MIHRNQLLFGALLLLCAWDASAQTATTRAPRSSNVDWTIWAQAIDPNTGQPLPNSSWESLGLVKATVTMSEPSQGTPRLTAAVTPVMGTNVVLVGDPKVTCATYPPTSNGAGYYARCDITVVVEKTTSIGSYKTTGTWKVDGGGSASGGPTGTSFGGNLHGEVAGANETTYTPKLRVTRSWSVGVNLYNTCQTTPAYSLYVSNTDNTYSSWPSRVPSQCAVSDSEYCGKGTDQKTGNQFVSQRGTSPRLYRTYRRPNGTTFEKFCPTYSSSCHAFPSINWYHTDHYILPYIDEVFTYGTSDTSDDWCNMSSKAYKYNHVTGVHDILVSNDLGGGGCACNNLIWNY